jgi:hypothetical protein
MAMIWDEGARLQSDRREGRTLSLGIDDGGDGENPEDMLILGERRRSLRFAKEYGVDSGG